MVPLLQMFPFPLPLPHRLAFLQVTGIGGNPLKHPCFQGAKFDPGPVHLPFLDSKTDQHDVLGQDPIPSGPMRIQGS